MLEPLQAVLRIFRLPVERWWLAMASSSRPSCSWASPRLSFSLPCMRISSARLLTKASSSPNCGSAAPSSW
jgi:hypothetical protein